jgi:transcriptional regulator with XRE-family HTH domain
LKHDEPTVYLSVVERRIAQRRLALGLTHEEAASRCGVSVRGYQALESSSATRRFNPGLLQVWNIAAGLEMEIEQLLAQPSLNDLTTLATQPKTVQRVNLKSRV